MRKALLFTITLFWLSAPAAALEWSAIRGKISGSPVEVMIHPKDPQRIYLATEKGVYLSAADEAWRRLFSLSGKHQIYTLYISPLNPNQIYVGSSRGLYVSGDSGKHWKVIYEGTGYVDKAVFTVTMDDQARLWIGTAKGILSRGSGENGWIKEEGAPDVAVHKGIFLAPSKRLLFLTERGIYARTQRAISEVLPIMRGESDEIPDEEGQTAEEATPVKKDAGLVWVPDQNKVYAVLRRWVWESADGGENWHRLTMAPSDEGIQMTAGTNTFYMATDNGLYEWVSQKNQFNTLNQGLPDNKVMATGFSREGQCLIAAGANAIYKTSLSRIYWAPSDERGLGVDSDNLLKHFENEPTIKELQNVAIHYAEVHPEKIQEWRRRAAKKAWLPQLSISRDMGEDNNVDVDRGGTGDPDRFIEGPEDRTSDWAVDVSWDLGELVWNSDQTSIDTRSRLLVELREDILNQLTHLYFERRRLQIEILLNPYKELDMRIEKELKLQELTAQIDALCGGYLSQRVSGS